MEKKTPLKLVKNDKWLAPFEPAIEALASKKITLPKIVKFDLSDFENAFAYSGFKAGFDFR